MVKELEQLNPLTHKTAQAANFGGSAELFWST